MDANHRKTCKRYDVPGHAHYLTFSCFQCRPFLNSKTSRAWVLDALNSSRRKLPFDLWAWVIMPQHVHLLVWPREGTPVSEILRHVKLPVAKRALIWARTQHPEILREMADPAPGGRTAYRFWQRGGGYDRNLWSAAEVHEKIHYIHANPVRRGLTEHPEQWPWSSWAAWNTGKRQVVEIDKGSVPALML